MALPYANRLAGGSVLAERLTAYACNKDVIVLALPRGGVPVGFAVSCRLHVPLDVLVVRKIGVPDQEELAMGAIGTGDICVLNESLINDLLIPRSILEARIERQRQEVARQNIHYRGEQPAPAITDKITLLIDDGLATGTTMRAAIAVVRARQPARVVVGVPVGAASACAELEEEADEVVCAATPTPFYGVGQWYLEFSQTTDAEVRAFLAGAANEERLHEQ